MEVPREETSQYGIVAGETWAQGLYRIRTLVEKPEPDSAPSNLAIIGRYLLPPIVFRYLEETERGAGAEIQLTDALGRLARERALIGYQFDGRRHDIGDKVGFLTANIAFGLAREDIGPKLREFLRTKIEDGEL